VRPWRQKPATIWLWWWLPCLLAIGLAVSVSTAAGLLVWAAAVAFALWLYE
jgi:hypothetical protein